MATNFTSNIQINTKGFPDAVRDLNKLDKSLAEAGREIKTFNDNSTIKVTAPKPPNFTQFQDSYKDTAKVVVKSNKEISEGFDIQGTTDFIAKVGASYVGLSEVISISNGESAESVQALERATRALVIANAIKDTGEVVGITLAKSKAVLQKLLTKEVKDTTDAVKDNTTAQNQANVAFTAGSKGVNLFKGAQNGLKTALGIGIITALIGGVSALVTEFGGFNEVISNVTASFKGLIAGAGQFISAIGSFFTKGIKVGFTELGKIGQVAEKAFDQSKNIDKANAALTEYRKKLKENSGELAKLEAQANNVYASEAQRLDAQNSLYNKQISNLQEEIKLLKAVEVNGIASAERIEKENELIALQNSALTNLAAIANENFNIKQKQLDNDQKLLKISQEIIKQQAEGKNTTKLEIEEIDRKIQLATQAIINAEKEKGLTQERRDEIIKENQDKLNGLILDKQLLAIKTEQLEKQAAQTIASENFKQKEIEVNNEINQANALQEEQNKTIERSIKYLDRQVKSENSITNILKNNNIERLKSEATLNNQKDQLINQYNNSLKLLNIEKEKIKIEEENNKKKLLNKEITQAEFEAQQKILETQKKQLESNEVNLKVNLDVATDDIDQQLSDLDLTTKIQNQVDIISFKATGETLGKSLIEGLGSELGLSGEVLNAQGERVFQEVTNIADQSIQLFNAITDLQQANIDLQLENIQTQKESIGIEIDEIEQGIESLNEEIEATAALFQDSVGARREFLNAQLEQQNQLINDKNNSLSEEKEKLKAVEAQEVKLNKEKEKIARQQMIIEADMQTLKAAGDLAANIGSLSRISLTAAETAAQTALAAATAAAQTGIGAPIAVPVVLGIIGAAVATAIGIVGSIRARLTKAEEGGQLNNDGTLTQYATGGMLHGNSHSMGGIRGTGKFSNIEVEGGEYIVNKKATLNNLPLLQQINSIGDSFKFASGGLLTPNPEISELAAQIPTQPNIKVSVVDIIQGIERVNVIDQNSFI